MPKVVAVHLRYAAKNYWFDPKGLELKEGDHVVVETARGKEIGLCVEEIKEVQEKELSAPLKAVVRLATEEDFKRADEMAKKAEEAFPRYRELAQQHGLDMKPVRVEYTFSGDYATFYFSADERIDFRALVRDLASEFHVRVDMRQIGVRDEARILGGLGHCGEELCCHRLGSEIQPVSIRMAKEQDLPLNPSKISGLCGRLMCCLRYEFEAYKDFKTRAPKKNAIIDTPLGAAKVVDFDTPREIVHLRLEDGQSLKIPLEAMDCEGAKPVDDAPVRPCHISQESLDRVLDDLQNDPKLALMGEKLFSTDVALADQVADNPHAEHAPRRRQRGRGQDRQDAGKRPEKTLAAKQQPERSLRKRRSVSVEDGSVRVAEQKTSEAAAQQNPSNNAGKQAKAEGASSSSSSNRRRRSRGKGGQGKGAAQNQQGQQGQQNQQNQQGQKQAPQQKQTPRQASQQAAHGGEGAKSAAAKEGSSQRKPRRRRRGGGNNGGGGNQGNSSGSQGGSAAQSGGNASASKPSKPRPGQHSSTLNGNH